MLTISDDTLQIVGKLLEQLGAMSLLEELELINVEPKIATELDKIGFLRPNISLAPLAHLRTFKLRRPTSSLLDVLISSIASPFIQSLVFHDCLWSIHPKIEILIWEQGRELKWDLRELMLVSEHHSHPDYMRSFYKKVYIRLIEKGISVAISAQAEAS